MAVVLFEADLYTLELDDMDKVINAFKITEMRKAVRVFLKAMLARIPIRTGFLKGAMYELNRAFGSEAGADFGSSNPKSKLTPAKILSVLFHGHADIEVGPNTAQELFKSREGAKDSKLSPAGRRKREQILEAQKKAAFLKRRAKENLRRKAKGLSRSTEQYQEYYYPGGGTKILKTDRSGIPFVTKPDDVLKITDNNIQFFMNINISYLAVNDFSLRGAGTPWGALDAGTAAMTSYLERAVNRFPDITEILSRFKIAVNSSGTLSTSTKRPDVEGVISSRFLKITAGL